MRRSTDDVTDTELAMLQVLWDRGSATRRQVTDALYPGGDAAHYATVQKLLERLEAKGYVHRDAEELAHRFTAAVAREELIGRRLRAMADELCGGSLAGLITGLVRTQPLRPSEIKELREVIDRAAARSRKRT